MSERFIASPIHIPRAECNENDSIQPTFSQEEWDAGERLLAEILPQARELSGDFKVELRSGLAKAVGPHLHEENLQALMIHEVPTGGFHADLFLKHVPHGISNVLGTEVGKPLATHREALMQGIYLVAHVLALAEGRKDDDDDETVMPIFELHGISLPLVPELLDRMTESAAFQTGDTVARKLEAMCKSLFSDGLTVDAMRRLDPSQIKIVMLTIHLAAAANVLRYPPLEVGQPDKD